jgi:hypothetical protein
VVAHGADLDGAKAARIRHRRSGHAGEDHGTGDIHMAEAAL